MGWRRHPGSPYLQTVMSLRVVARGGTSGLAKPPDGQARAACYPPQEAWSKLTVTVPLAFSVAWALSWNCRCEPSVPVALTLNVECSTPLRRLFSSPNHVAKC